MPYTRAARPNVALDLANLFVADLGAPALAVVDRYVASVAMGNKTYTLANAGLPGDGLARNVTLKRTVVAAGADTPGKITITGLDIDGRPITEDIIPGADGVTVQGLFAFKSIDAPVGSGWVIAGGADTIEIGFGTKVGLPASIRQSPPVLATTQIPFALLGGVNVTPVVTYDAAIIAKCTVDASSGTYDGTKRLLAFVLR